MTWLSRVAATAEKLQVIALQARINAKSNKIKHFHYFRYFNRH